MRKPKGENKGLCDMIQLVLSKNSLDIDHKSISKKDFPQFPHYAPNNIPPKNRKKPKFKQKTIQNGEKLMEESQIISQEALTTHPQTNPTSLTRQSHLKCILKAPRIVIFFVEKSIKVLHFL